MNELITITTGGQGSPVVSARELYGFLGLNKTAFSRWAKKNIENNSFACQGEDWEGFDIMLNGNEVKDYALTLDFAKRLSMLARTEKGEQARQYFLDCERKAKQPAPPSTDQLLIQLISQSNQLMVSQQEMLAQLRTDVDSIINGNRPAKKLPPHLSRKARQPASVRQLINRAVNDYCTVHGATQSETYSYLYKRMYDVYGVNVHRLQRRMGEYILDALERHGHLERLYSLIKAELNYSDDE